METAKEDEQRMDDAGRIMIKVIALAIQKIRASRKDAQNEQDFQDAMTEAFYEVPSTFKDRAELSVWHNKCVDRSRDKVQTYIDSLKKAKG